MTNPTPHGQVPEALRLAHIFDNPLPPEWPDMVAAAAELRRQHARIAELEAVGAGGVQPLQPTPKAARTPHLLAADHKGMRVDYSGLLSQCRRALQSREPANAEMLRQLQGHLQELGRLWYAGDTVAVDEFLQLYCIEHEARVALAAQKGK